MRMLLCLLALVAAPAYSEWVKMGVDEDGTVYIDPATIRKDGHLRRVWGMTDMRQRDPIGGEISRRALVEYDCKKLQVRVRSGTLHSEPMARGKGIVAVDVPDTWFSIAPNSIDVDILTNVCSR